MTGLWLYSALPIVSSIACLYLLGKLISKESTQESILLFINLAVLNLFQAITYLSLPYSIKAAEHSADAYLIAAYFLFANLLLFTIGLSGNPSNVRYRYLIFTLPGLLTIFHLLGFMVDGYRIEGNVILHNDGPYAFAFDVFLLFSCIATASSLWWNIKTHYYDKIIASKNIIALISFIPLIMATMALCLLSTTSYVVPVVVIVPTVTLYTALSFYYLQRERVFYLSVGIRFFIQRLKLANMILEMDNTKSDIKSYSKAVEKQFIIEALERHQGRIQDTADYLGMNHTTLRNKIKEYEVSVQTGRPLPNENSPG